MSYTVSMGLAWGDIQVQLVTIRLGQRALLSPF